MDADGCHATQLTTDPASPKQIPEWSPDGRRIAYSSRASGAGDIYVMNADGSHQRRLTTDPGPETGPAWSPDGTKIAFLRSAAPDTGSSIVVMDVDGTHQRAVYSQGVQYVPAWQPRPRRR
jgi:Tol biopolymer transport system component